MVKISEVDLPIVFKNQPLFVAGRWNPKTNNNFNFTKEMVNNSVQNTKWTSLNKRLYLKHSGAFDISKWKGNVENIRADDGTVYGDIVVWDAEEGIGIKYGKKPVAISADIEYNDNGIMFFKGFALENDPGVKDSKMFLSDAVKDELSGMYRASFSSELNTDNIVQNDTQVNPMNNIEQNNTQSAERRLNETVNMEGQKDTSVNQSNPQQPIINVNTTGADVELVRKLSEKIEALEKQNVELSAKVDATQTPKVEVKEEPVKEEPQIKTVMPSENVDDLVNKIAEKIKPVITPRPITSDEFSGQGDGLTGDRKMIEKLAGYFEKK